MSGQRPTVKVMMVPKTKSAPARGLLAAWLSDDGSRLQGKADKVLASVTFTDGTVWNAGDCYINVYDNRMEDGPPRRREQPAPATRADAPPQDSAPDFGDDDIPF